MHLNEIQVRPVESHEENDYQELMQKYHYLGALAKIGETLWYVATYREQWIALLGFSSAAWKCAARDRWIGWDYYRQQYARLNLVTNNSRFLILQQWHYPNAASRILSLCQKRLSRDWLKRFEHPLLLLETFVDQQHFQGTIYKANNWTYLGNTKGFSRTREGYSSVASSPKMVFVRPLQRNATKVLSCPVLDPSFRSGATKMMLNAEHMRSLPGFFVGITDPRRAQGRRHRLATVLAISAGAVLCGRRGYKDISDWAQNLSHRERERFWCCLSNRNRLVPSKTIIRNVLTQIDPDEFEQAIQRWNQAYAQEDESLEIDIKSLCNAYDDEDCQCLA